MLAQAFLSYGSRICLVQTAIFPAIRSHNLTLPLLIILVFSQGSMRVDEPKHGPKAMTQAQSRKARVEV